MYNRTASRINETSKIIFGGIFMFGRDLDEMNDAVVSGQLSSVEYRLASTEGRCVIIDIEAKEQGGHNFLEFLVCPENNPKSQFKLSLWLPNSTSKDGAKYFAMQRLYATLYAAFKQDPKVIKPGDLYNKAKESLQTKSLLVDYTIEEKETTSKNGRIYKNQSPLTFDFVKTIEKVEIVSKQEPVPTPSTTDTYDFNSDNDVPF
jgi:hypothetical protein